MKLFTEINALLLVNNEEGRLNTVTDIKINVHFCDGRHEGFSVEICKSVVVLSGDTGGSNAGSLELV